VKLPDGWREVRLKYAARRLTERSGPGLPMLGLENVEPWTGVQIGEPAVAEGEALRYLAGDVLFGKLRPYLAKVLAARSDGACTSEMLVLRPRAPLQQRFLFYRMIAPDFIDAVNASTFGSKMPRAAWEFVGRFTVFLPSPTEQVRVCDWLDEQLKAIDGLMAKKQQLIDLLEEKWAALISRAVTQGLDPSVPIKDSGVEWLGRVPAHWETTRTKYAICSMSQGWSPQCDTRVAERDEWGVLKVGCVNGWQFDPQENKALPIELEPDPALEVLSGDVLISRANTRELVGSAASVPRGSRSRLLLCDKLYRIRTSHKLEPDFLALLLRTPRSRAQIEPFATGTSGSMQNIAQDVILNLWLVLPSRSEQLCILNEINERGGRIEAAKRQLRETIERLREYRSALIGAAVTGQLDISKHERQMEGLA
jgi:type I restriction enzyme S subunit